MAQVGENHSSWRLGLWAPENMWSSCQYQTIWKISNYALDIRDIRDQ